MVGGENNHRWLDLHLLAGAAHLAIALRVQHRAKCPARLRRSRSYPLRDRHRQPPDNMEPPNTADASASAPATVAPTAASSQSSTPATMRDRRKIAAWRVAHGHTQAGLGERLIQTHGKELRYHAEHECWYRWDACRWCEADDAAVLRQMLELIRSLSATDPEFACMSQSRPQVDGALRFAADSLTSTGESIRIRERDLNREHDLIPVKNGVINLREGVCLPANPGHLFTKSLDVAFDTAARCPKWERFLRDVCTEDMDLVRWFQVYLGHCLSGRTDSQCIVWLHGDGGNGKGVLIRVMDRLLAKFAVTTPATTFAEQSRTADSSRPSPELATFAGARLVTASETNAQVAVDAAFIKWTTGGDTLKARFLHKNPFEFWPTHKTIISTNHEPIIKVVDHGMIRRIRIVPLRAQFAAGAGYKGTLNAPSFRREEELHAELPGILNWLIRGAKAWYDAGADSHALAIAAPCDAVERETARFLSAQDSMGAFLSECTVDKRTVPTPPTLFDKPLPRRPLVPDVGVLSRDLYAAYVGWCDEHGMVPVHQNRFGRQITDRGYVLEHSNGGVRRGLALTGDGLRLKTNGATILRLRAGRQW